MSYHAADGGARDYERMNSNKDGERFIMGSFVYTMVVRKSS